MSLQELGNSSSPGSREEEGSECVQDGRVYPEDDDWELDSCTTCSCQVSLSHIAPL